MPISGDTELPKMLDQAGVAYSGKEPEQPNVLLYLLIQRGASFLTPPVTNGAQTRAFFRDPDGSLFEISEYRSADA